MDAATTPPRRSGFLLSTWLIAAIAQWLIATNPGYFSHDELGWAVAAGVDRLADLPWVAWSDLAAFQWRPTPELEIYVDGLFQGYRGKDTNQWMFVPIFGGPDFRLENVTTRAGRSNVAQSATVVGATAPDGYYTSANGHTDTYQGGGGAVLNISSVRANLGINAGYSAYVAAKGAISSLTRQWATEWAKHGIRVNAIMPTFVDTPQVAMLLEDPTFKRRSGLPAPSPPHHAMS